MNKTVNSVKRVGTDTADAFFRRSATRAQKLDRGEALLPEMRLTFEDPADLLRVLTEQRVRILNAVRRNPAPVPELAAVLRDRTAVRRDVRFLTTFGLVKIREETNPGHGRRKSSGRLPRRPEVTSNQAISNQETEGLAKFTYKHFVTASSRSRLGKATESTTLTEPQPLGRGNGTKAVG